MNTFLLHVYTPESVFWEGEVQCVSVPLASGHLQYLAHHQEELTTILDGVAYYRTPQGDRVDFCTSGGVAYFDGAECWLLCTHAASSRDWNEQMQAHADYLRQEAARRRQSMHEHLLGTAALNKAFVAMRGKPTQELDN